MAKRLTRITTRTGDDGTTGLGDGTRLPKDDPLIAAIGDVDELNSWIGYLVSELGEADTLRNPLVRCQHLLFDLGGELSVPGAAIIDEEDVAFVETATRALNEELSPLENFILPGGSRAASICQLARAVCRRCERALIALGKERPVNRETRVLLNRLSDLLFVIARSITRTEGGEEILWLPKPERD